VPPLRVRHGAAPVWGPGLLEALAPRPPRRAYKERLFEKEVMDCPPYGIWWGM
jgi:hypothetical protein